MDTIPENARITVAGAGSIGGHTGACLALAGRRLTFLGRPGPTGAMAGRGITVSDLDGTRRHVQPSAYRATSDAAAALADADVVLVTVKGGATEEMAGLVAAYAPQSAVVVSLQNGVGNAAILRGLVGARRVVAGMVPYNVVQSNPAGAPPSFHRATSGIVLIETGIAGLHKLLDVPGLPVAEAGDMDAVLWGKLLLNLNNALNGLSGLPLATQLADRRWRLVLARQMREALAAMDAAGIRPARIGAMKPALLPFLLGLPDPVFKLLARRMLAIDPEARSSTWEDLQRGRPTEIDSFQGEILRLGALTGTKMPLTATIVDAVRRAERAGRGSPGLAPEVFGA